MNRVRSVVVVFSLAVLFLGAPASATAEPIQILSGYIWVGGAEHSSRGFLRSIGYDITTESFRLTGSESDGPTQKVLFPALARVAGWNAPNNTNAFIDYGGLRVSATPGLAPSPFSLSGRVRVTDMVTLEVLFDDILFGSGTATWRWLPNMHNDGIVLGGAQYDFSDAVVTPEPATMLLLGTGLAALAARRRRQVAARD